MFSSLPADSVRTKLLLRLSHGRANERRRFHSVPLLLQQWDVTLNVPGVHNEIGSRFLTLEPSPFLLHEGFFESAIPTLRWNTAGRPLQPQKVSVLSFVNPNNTSSVPDMVVADTKTFSWQR